MITLQFSQSGETFYIDSGKSMTGISKIALQNNFARFKQLMFNLILKLIEKLVNMYEKSHDKRTASSSSQASTCINDDHSYNQRQEFISQLVTKISLHSSSSPLTRSTAI